MNRQTFEELSIEDQVAYMNERSRMTLKQIAEEFKDDMPASSLSTLFGQRGYKRVKGFYVEKEAPKQSTQESPSELQELLQYKDQIIEMVLKQQQHQTSAFDFSFLNQFGDEKKTIGFDCPIELAAQVEAFIKNSGYKKQAVLTLAVWEFMQKYHQ